MLLCNLLYIAKTKRIRINNNSMEHEFLVDEVPFALLHKGVSSIDVSRSDQNLEELLLVVSISDAVN